MSNHLIEIKDLHKHFVMPGFVVKALDGVDLTIDKGEYVAQQRHGRCGAGSGDCKNDIGDAWV